MFLRDAWQGPKYASAQLTFTIPKSTIETLEKGVKYA